MTNYAGIELGGTKCIAVLADGSRELLGREVVPTTSSDETLSRVERILTEWKTSHGFDSLGIASFGPIDLDEASQTYGHLRSTPKPGWSGVDIGPRLERAAGVPTTVDTDVNGAAFAEMRWGSGRGMDDFAYITVGTGVGVGLIANGRPVRGFGHCELGHIRVARLAGDEWPGACPFHEDCVEGLASGTALRARFGDAVESLSSDDPVWDSVAWTLAQLCHTIVLAAASKRIAIGGGVVERQPHLLQRIEAKLIDSLNDYVELPHDGPYVRAPELGDDAGPLGAIAL
ncbi:MAG: ROK family protein, partial [Sphingomonas sp.]|nr:ROK family protein [Sphingomonas sp.]